MSNSVTSFDLPQALSQMEMAQAERKISTTAAENIRAWLTESRYADYAPEVARHIAERMWQELDDAFWTIIPFGTGGRRGRMVPIGSNAINDRTIGESAQGLAEYVLAALGESDALACAIAYDTRHRSEHFARLCAGIMVASGFKVYFLQGVRSTPELSFAVRYKKCSCGIMVTASHNPPSDNAVKVYWSSGAQVLPPHDKGIIERVMNTQEITCADFDNALAEGKIVCCQEEVDAKYIDAVATQSVAGPRELKIIFSPLHGVGASAVIPALARDGFTDVELFGPHSTEDGDFPNVPGHVSNPENPEVFKIIIERGREVGADLILASDPDCDRIGAAAPLSLGSQDWDTFTGNQIGSLLADFILESRGDLSAEHYVAKTLVTTEMIRRIADSYGVQTRGDLLVGFKWIGGLIDEFDPNLFVFGTEESHGYLAGQYVRDKDGGLAAMLLAELAAKLKAEGKTLHEKLDDLFWQFGCHAERTISIKMPGSEGMAKMQELMTAFRAKPPQSLAGLSVAAVRDYENQQKTIGGATEPLAGPKGDMVILDLDASGNYIAVRPSGTEPKVKFYMFTFTPAEQLANLEDSKAELNTRLDAIEADLNRFAKSFA